MLGNGNETRLNDTSQRWCLIQKIRQRPELVGQRQNGDHSVLFPDRSVGRFQFGHIDALPGGFE